MPSATAVTIGTFDGVHLGHRKILQTLLKQAKRRCLKSLVLAFEKTPKAYFHPEQSYPSITLPHEREVLLKQAGVEQVEWLKFTKKLAQTEAEDFFESYLVKRLKAKCIVAGRNFVFGKDRRGNTELLKRLCRKHGIVFSPLPLLSRNDGIVSSTALRRLLAEGSVEEAKRLLGYSYFLEGAVERGRGLGSRIGFPTANLIVHPGKLLPPGVFKVRVKLGSKSWLGAANIGHRPTIGGLGTGGRGLGINSELRTPASGFSVEVHLIGFEGNLTGKILRLEFLKKIREEKKFPSLEALKKQISRDIRSIRSYISVSK